MIYNYITDIIGYTGSTGQNSTIIYIAGFFVTMVFVLFVDILVNGFFGLFRKERRK